MFKKVRCLLVLTLLVAFFSVIIVDAQQVSTAAKADLVDSLEGLREAMLKKINCDIDITAQAFTDVKDYWRSKRWADIFTTPLRILEDTLNLLAKAADIKSLSKDANAALKNSETLYQALSVVMMYQDLQKVGEKLYWGLNGPNYVVSIESMLEEADATFVPPFGDNWQKYYKETIENYLYGTTEKIPLIIPRRSTTAERKNIEFAKGALQVRSRITRTFNNLIDEIKSTELLEDFPVGEATLRVKGLTTQVRRSMSYSTDMEYKINFQDPVKVKLGAVGELYKVFGQVAGMVAKKLEIEQRVEILKFMESTGSAALLYTTIYKMPGVEEIKIAQKATVLPELIIYHYKNTFYSDSEKVFYMLPQDMILSMPTELSNLWMIADDIDQYLRCFYQKIATPVITSPLKITSPPYYVGDIIDAEFTITNKESIPIALSTLTVGGRDPDNQVADFTHRQNITLKPSESYDYEGTLLLDKIGNYHFFCTYQTLDDNWNTSIDLSPELTDGDRVKDIIIKEKEKPPGAINKTNIIHNLTKDTYYDIIQKALNDADSGDTIEVADGTYDGSVTFPYNYDGSVTFPYNKSIILKSVNGASSTTIQCVRIEESLEGTILEGFTITGGGISVNSGNLTIKNCTISGNTGYKGGGIKNYAYGIVTIIGSTISNNKASSKGGGIYNDGHLTIIGSTISNNRIGRKGEPLNWGGGIWNTGHLTITGSTISNNYADHGGGIFNYKGSLTITGSTISNNYANHGGGIENQASLIIVKSTISGNEGNYEGGGIDNSWHCTLILTGNTISNNFAKRGGGIYIGSYAKITIGGNSTEEKNIICGNYKSGEHPSIDQQISGVFVREDLYETNKDFNYKDFNTISVYCGPGVRGQASQVHGGEDEKSIKISVGAVTLVEFEDYNLEQVVRETIGKPEGSLYLSDVIGIEKLDAKRREIKYLKGIQHFQNLYSLNLGDNQIKDISSLENLTNLKDLEFYSNQVTDISALENLTNLHSLNLNDNQIKDISSLENLTNLKYLGLQHNQVTDISALENLTNLYYLIFSHNQVTDITVLENLTNLQYLYFYDNQVTDITVLENLTNLQVLYSWDNQVTDITAVENLTNLWSLRFGGNQVTDITAVENLTNLQSLYFDENYVKDISVLENLTNLDDLRFYSNQVTDISALVKNEGLGPGDYISMRDNYLDLTEGSQNMQDIENLISRGVDVRYEPQRNP